MLLESSKLQINSNVEGNVVTTRIANFGFGGLQTKCAILKKIMTLDGSRLQIILQPYEMTVKLSKVFC